MICMQCGNFIEEGQIVCGKCGMAIQQLNQQNPRMQPGQQYQPSQTMPQTQQWQQQPNPQLQPNQSWQQQTMRQSAPMSKKEFYRHPNLLRVKKDINACAICLYICIGISLVMSLLTNLSGLIDVVLLIGLGLGIQLGKSRVCSIILAVYAGFNTLVMLVTAGRLGGYLIILVAIYSIISTFKFHKLYQEYLSTGVIPVIPEKGKMKVQ